jgi:hypothetical protein
VDPLWTRTGPLGGRLLDIESDPGGTVWIGGDAMTPHTGVPNGWAPIPESSGLPPNTWDFGRFAPTPSLGLAANMDAWMAGGVFQTQNGAANWVELTTDLPVKGKNYRAAAIDPTDSQVAYVGNADPDPTIRGVWATGDGGTVWSLVLPGVLPNAIAAGSGPLAYNVFVATPAGTYRSTDKGATWAVDAAFPTVDVAVDGAGSMV